ncbi:MAG: hypothetical protein HY547_04080 [Elusimicrobia bacterium]|nr:hypothetical protein [Elusimicrobiota bacterium]
MEKAISVLNKMVEDGVIENYAIGGAVAALFYAEPVETFDLDVFVIIGESKSSILSLSPIYRYLKEKGYHSKKEHIWVRGIPIQFLVPYNALIEEALREAVQKKFNHEQVRVMRAEHLMAVMAQTGRAKDKIRISILRQQAKYDERRLRDILKRHGLAARWKIVAGDDHG